MRKKFKLFGIGAAVLLITLAFMPCINAEQQTVEQVLESYEDEIEDIQDYVDDYIDANGGIDEDFELTSGLQDTLDEIVDDAMGAQGGGGGGINDVDVTNGWGWLGPYSIWIIWIDDYYTDLMVTLGPAGLAIIAIILIIVSAGALASVAWVIASLIIGYGLMDIDNINQGDGVKIKYFDWWLFGVAFDYIDYIVAQ
jgi:hypothetical protein